MSTTPETIAELTDINQLRLSYPDDFTSAKVSIDTITVRRGSEVVKVIEVESSEDPAHYDAALERAGITDYRWAKPLE